MLCANNGHTTHKTKTAKLKASLQAAAEDRAVVSRKTHQCTKNSSERKQSTDRQSSNDTKKRKKAIDVVHQLRDITNHNTKLKVLSSNIRTKLI